MQYLGITGGPGTGKKTIAPQVAKLLGIRSYNLNELAAAFEVIDANHEVDTEKLGRSLSSEVQAPALLFGHLLPYVVSRNQIAKIAVLRCDPKMLKSRLAKRRYDHRKLAENVEAELLGVISADCVAKFGRGRVADFDTTDSEPRSVAEAVASYFTKRNARGVSVDWLSSYSSEGELRALLSPPRIPSPFT